MSIDSCNREDGLAKDVAPQITRYQITRYRITMMCGDANGTNHPPAVGHK